MSGDLHVDRDSGVPVGTQLVWRLRARIECGELRPGDQLPSLRDVAAAAGVNVNTVRAAYARLEAAGIVTTAQGRGTFVTPQPVEEESGRRRALRNEIARLEATLAALPLRPPSAPDATRAAGAGPRLLSVDELAAVRDLLAERVSELQATRAEIVERLAAGALDSAQAASVQRPAPRRSSSSLAGARVHWTGA
ncbi:MAG TPA: GntR family transcriptional regulator [Thermoleophilaceae bacterium]|nr:GntR family transcriptional regulator [Thermoleophilaceae bacterium]